MLENLWAHAARHGRRQGGHRVRGRRRGPERRLCRHRRSGLRAHGRPSRPLQARAARTSTPVRRCPSMGGVGDWACARSTAAVPQRAQTAPATPTARRPPPPAPSAAGARLLAAAAAPAFAAAAALLGHATGNNNVEGRGQKKLAPTFCMRAPCGGVTLHLPQLTYWLDHFHLHLPFLRLYLSCIVVGDYIYPSSHSTSAVSYATYLYLVRVLPMVPFFSVTA